jgi:hypothetical protein
LAHRNPRFHGSCPSYDGIAAPIVLWMSAAGARPIIEASAHWNLREHPGLSLAVGTACAPAEHGRTQMQKPEPASPSTRIPLNA